MSEPDRTKRKKRRRTALMQTLFLDVFLDSRTRPIFIYVAIFIALASVIFHWLEGWAWIDSFYFVVITFTTIGYGDFTPTTPLTKLITIFVGLNGIVILLMLFDVIRQVRHWNLPGSEPPDADEISAEAS